MKQQRKRWVAQVGHALEPVPSSIQAVTQERRCAYLFLVFKCLTPNNSTMRVLQRFLGLVFAIYCLLGCGNLRNPYSVKATPSSSHTQPPSFSAQRGAVVSLAQDGTGAWMASVTEPLLPNAPRVVPVRFESGDPMGAVAALAGLSASQQRSMLHVFPTAAGPEILYVGKVGLKGGGLFFPFKPIYELYGFKLCSVGNCMRLRMHCVKCLWTCTLHCATHCFCVCQQHGRPCPACQSCIYCPSKCTQCCRCVRVECATCGQRHTEAVWRSGNLTCSNCGRVYAAAVVNGLKRT